MQQKYLNTLGTLLTIQGVWQFLGGLGLCFFMTSILNETADQPKSCDACGLGLIFIFFIGIALTLYSVLLMTAGWRLLYKKSGSQIFAVAACILSVFQTIYATPILFATAFDENSNFYNFIVFALCLTFPLYLITPIYAGWMLLAKNKKSGAAENEN